METRQLPWDLNLRASDDGTAALEGRAVPYGQTIDLGGVRETFRPGSVDPADLTGAPILWQHDRSEVIGVIKSAENRDDGAYFTAELIPTTRGRDAIIAARAGAVTGLSIGFETVEDVWPARDHVERARVRVREVSIATIPAYPGAEILAVRNQQEESTVEKTTPEVPQVDLANLATREDLTALESRMTATLSVREPAPVHTLNVREAFTLQLADAQKSGQVRALADVLSSGNAGVLPPQWSSEVRNFVDRQRYTFAACGSIGFPSVGYTLTIPKITQHVQVGPRGTEKTEVPSRALTTGSDVYTAKWFAGGVDVALELIWQSDPAIFPIIVESMLGEYASTTDAALTVDLTAAATATGAAIVTTSYSTFVASVIAQAEVIRAATGEWGDRLMLTTATWQKLIGMVDADGRRILAPVGASNADGTAALLSRSVDIGGVYAFHNPRASVDLIFNAKSARVAEKPPVTITQDVVALMGRDLGVLGAYLFVPAYPAGIRKFAAAAR